MSHYVPLGDLSSKVVFLKVQINDVVASLIFFGVGIYFLRKYDLTILSVLVPLSVLGVMGSIRNTYREGIIIDTLEYHFIRWKKYASVYTRT